MVGTMRSWGVSFHRRWLASLLAFLVIMALGGRVAAQVVVMQPPPPAAATGPLRAAILLPLSGPQAAMGQALLQAAQLALFEVSDERLELLPRDTGGSPAKAQAALRDALASGAKLILGPLFGTEANALRPLAAAAGVPMITFSNDVGLAGGGVYVFGFGPEQETQRVISFALSQGYRRLAVIAPQGAYGERLLRVTHDALGAQGGELTLIARPSASDPASVLKEIKAGQGHFDAVLMGSGGQELRVIAAQGVAQGLWGDRSETRMQLLGTGQWDEPSLSRESGLIGGWYPAADPATRQAFAERYKRAFGLEPPRLATLGYDAVALASVLSRQGSFGASIAWLTQSGGFSGVDGIFRLRPDGLTERGLAVLTPTVQGPQVVDPALQVFAATMGR
ncbi:MAG: penicillin-binding protein activator [Alphaproteobacteria bacterium]|nr:MAG: penicillin-binding protein activator [Alphaproteobacteria bacterium]